MDGMVSRRKFVALGGGGAAAAFLAACGDDDDSGTTTTMGGGAGGGDALIEEEFGKGDVGILNYALTLEYLEAAFYADVIEAGLFKGSDLATIEKFGETENEHVEALTATVKSAGGKPAPKPKTEFPLNNAKEVLELAGTVEDLGAAAYLGQAPMSNEKLLHLELAAVEVDEDSGGDLSRGDVILKGALAIGAVYGATMAGPFVRQALAQSGSGDVDILNSATLRLANVRDLPSDEVLQAWVQRGERVESADALFVPDDEGMAMADLDDLEGVEVVMVSVEPEGGSDFPTTDPIVSVAIPN